MENSWGFDLNERFRKDHISAGSMTLQDSGSIMVIQQVVDLEGKPSLDSYLKAGPIDGKVGRWKSKEFQKDAHHRYLITI